MGEGEATHRHNAKEIRKRALERVIPNVERNVDNAGDRVKRGGFGEDANDRGELAEGVVGADARTDDARPVAEEFDADEQRSEDVEGNRERVKWCAEVGGGRKVERPPEVFGRAQQVCGDADACRCVRQWM